MRRLVREHVSSGAGFALIGMYLASYLLLQYSGLFGPRPGNILRVLHHTPSLAGVAALLVYGIAWGSLRRTGGAPGRRRNSIVFVRLAYAGMMLCGAGILLSSMTRFEGSFALTEGQEAYLSAASFDAGTLYRRRFSKVPQGYLMVGQIGQFLPAQGKRQKIPVATVLYRDPVNSTPRIVQINSWFPSLHDGNAMSLIGVGFSPHVFLYDRGGGLIDNFYAVLQLLPAGTEDMFRFEGIIPHTFYMRYYPDVSFSSDVSASSPIKSGPVFKVRIARNLDIVADQYAAPDEAVYFDKLVFSAGDVKKWVEVQIVRDPGMYLVWPGMALLLCGAIAMAVRKFMMKADA